MTKPTFDMDAAIAALKAGKGLTGKDGILTPLIKQLTEAAMQAELEQHLENDEDSNRKNGSTPKTVKSAAGSFAAFFKLVVTIDRFKRPFFPLL